MSRKRIRIAVAGLGRIGWSFHCANIAKSPNFELAAVADTEAERRAEAESVHGCPAFAEYDDMLANSCLDAVVIATPTHLHKAHALAAFREGLHVFLEKPMALDLAEARAIARAARRAGRILTVYQPRRAAAWFQQLSRMVRSGRIGKLYHVRIGMFSFARRDDWQSLRKYGGGMLNNYGAHALDQALALTGRDVGRVFCNLRRVASLGDTDDVVKIVYETRRGVLGEVDINQACAVNPYEMEVYGTTGAIAKEKDKLRLTRFSTRDLKPKKLKSRLASPGREYPRDDVDFKEKIVKINPRCQVDVYKDLAAAIRTGRPPLVDPAETLAVMKLIQQCREDSGRIVLSKM